MSLSRSSLLAVAALALSAASARAQQAAAGGQMACCANGAMAQMPESYREVQIRALETERNMILHMIDSMPAQFFREKATPAQRDFGQQLYHAATAVRNISAGFMGAPRASYPDTTAGFDKAGLRTYVGNVYDAAVGFARSEPAADREAIITFFGNPMPKWQVWDELHEHTMWTLGQTVANFRMHGMPPAAFMFF